MDDPLDDDLLRLTFTACHPVLSTDARVALTLRLLCGLTTREIARAYLTSEATLASAFVEIRVTSEFGLLAVGNGVSSRGRCGRRPRLATAPR